MGSAVDALIARGPTPPQIESSQDIALKQAQAANLGLGAQEQALKNQQIQQQLGEYNTIKQYVGQNGGDYEKALSPGSPLLSQISPETALALQSSLAKTGESRATTLKANADADKARADAADAVEKLHQAHWDHVATLAYSLKDAPPAAVATGLDNEAMRYQDDPLVLQTIGGIKQAIAQDPTKTGPLMQQLMSKGPEAVAKLQEQDNKNAAAKQAAEKAPLESAQLEATTAETKQRTATAAQQAADAKVQHNANILAQAAKVSPMAYQSVLTGLAPEDAAPFANAKTPEDILAIGMKPSEVVSSAQKGKEIANTAQAQAETARHNKAEEGIAGTRENRENQIFNQTYGPGANPALQGVDPKLRVAATAAAQKAADEYTKGSAAEADLQTFLDLARKGNKEAYAYMSPEGVLTLNTGRGVTRVNRQEIDAYAGAGSLMDNLAGKIGKWTKGQSIPADVLNDIDTLHKAIAANGEANYNNKLAGINQNYKANFQPVPVRGASSSSPEPSGVPPAVSKALSTVSPGVHKLSDGTTWKKDKDGTITKQ